MILVNPLNTPRTLHQPPVIKICRKVLLVLHQFFVGLTPSIRAGKEVPSVWNDLSSASENMDGSTALEKSQHYLLVWGVSDAQKGLVAGSGSSMNYSSICCSYKILVICLIPVSVSSLVLGTVQVVARVPVESYKGRNSSVEELFLQAAAVTGRVLSPSGVSKPAVHVSRGIPWETSAA